jgi:hypothetical protein
MKGMKSYLGYSLLRRNWRRSAFSAASSSLKSFSRKNVIVVHDDKQMEDLGKAFAGVVTSGDTVLLRGITFVES